MTQVAKTIYRIFCCYSEKPILRNFDKINNIADCFKNGFFLDYDPDVKIVDHSNINDLCQWSYQVIDLLSDVETDSETKTKNNALIGHLLAIKNFYSVYSKENSDKLQKFQDLFYTIESYECVVSLSFPLFLKSDKIMIEINELLKKFCNIFEEYNKKCFTLIDRIGNRGFYKEFDFLIQKLNAKFGDFDLMLISDFVKEIGSYMCKYNQINLNDTKNLSDKSELIAETASLIQEKLNELDPAYDQSLIDRSKRTNLLKITKRIEKNLEKFDSKELVLRKTYFSFEQIYKSMQKVNDDLVLLTQDKKRNEINFKNVNITSIEKLIQDISITKSIVEEIETIIFFMVFYFENREDILYPLSGHLDEISRIYEKFLSFHIIYRVTYAKNYLNKTKSVINRIIELFDNSLVEIKSTIFVLNELKRRYIDLLMLDSVKNVNDNQSARPESLIEVSQELDSLFDLIIEELKAE